MTINVWHKNEKRDSKTLPLATYPTTCAVIMGDELWVRLATGPNDHCVLFNLHEYELTFEE